ncbi:MAG: hypothetical protein AAGF92_01340 [Myxococcota bacterium]
MARVSRWTGLALAVALLVVCLACGDDSASCSNQQAVYRFSPAPPSAANVTARVVCPEPLVERHGCDFLEFRVVSSDGTVVGQLEFALEDLDAACQGAFTGVLFGEPEVILMSGSEVSMSDAGVLVAGGEYVAGAAVGQVEVVISPKP